MDTQENDRSAERSPDAPDESSPATTADEPTGPRVMWTVVGLPTARADRPPEDWMVHHFSPHAKEVFDLAERLPRSGNVLAVAVVLTFYNHEDTTRRDRGSVVAHVWQQPGTDPTLTADMPAGTREGEVIDAVHRKVIDSLTRKDTSDEQPQG